MNDELGSAICACGGETKCVDSRVRPDGNVRRKRVCLSCGERWGTVEIRRNETLTLVGPDAPDEALVGTAAVASLAGVRKHKVPQLVINGVLPIPKRDDNGDFVWVLGDVRSAFRVAKG